MARRLQSNDRGVLIGSPASRGAFIVLVGPDGVGKTTVADELMNVWGRQKSRYFHFLPKGGIWDQPEPGQASRPSRPRFAGVLGWLRLLTNVVRFSYAHVRYVRPLVRSGFLVIGDRWAYGYLLDPGSLGFAGPRGLAHTALSLLPQPHMVAALWAPAEVIQARKPELTTGQIQTQLDLARSLPGNLRIVDASGDLLETVQRLTALIGEAIER